jgi:carbamoyltransferase
VSSYILGISCFYHDSAATLLKDGEIVAAAQEERFTRIKQDSSFPHESIKFCLKQQCINLEDIEAIYYYEDPEIKFGRIISTYMNFGTKGLGSFVSDVPKWITHKCHIKSAIRKEIKRYGRCPRIEYIPHHESHAASAYFPSPYEDAAILCIDGVGEWATTSAWLGKSNTLTKLWEIRFPHSLGLLYSAFTYFCGFKVDSGEYKLMGLAPYGSPVYFETIVNNLIDIKEDGSFWLDMTYFDYPVGNKMTSSKFDALFGGPRRQPESRLTKREFDMAASIQAVLEDVVYKIARNVQEETGAKNLCLAGGVALNCVSNGKLARSGIFDSIWAQPASGDSGGSLGAAVSGWHTRMNKPRTVNKHDSMLGTYLGTQYTDNEIESYLKSKNAVYKKFAEADIPSATANILSAGNVVGWFQGRMEFGPRSLGARSILGDARNSAMQTTMNLKIKNRESFRPFAPAVLADKAKMWFDIPEASPYMLFVHPVLQMHRLDINEDDEQKEGIEKLKVNRSTVPAITHVDYTARVQTVDGRTNPKFYSLLNKFYELTECPVLVNTSFNVRGEPIVESPEHAYTCFMRTAMDYLVIGNFVLQKTDQPDWKESIDWKQQFQLD